MCFMIGNTNTSVLAIYLPPFFLTQIVNLTHYPRNCWITVYILKGDLPPSGITLSPIVFVDLRIVPDYSDAKNWN